MSTSQATAGQYLTFFLSHQVYGIPIGTVREINRVSEITLVPQTPTYVSGVINLRGKVIPVVNLRQRIGMEKIDYTRETCIIVIECDSGQIGMIVDSVSGVIELGQSQIEPCPDLNSDQTASFVMGMGKLDDQIVIIVDIVKCLSSEQIAELKKINPTAA